MTRRQSVVVEEHSALQLEVFLQERHGLDLALIFLETRRVFRETGNFFNKPDVGGLGNVLVTVDLGLLVAPVRKWCCVRPHGYFRREVDKLEVGRHGLELLLALSILDFDFE